MNEKTGGPAADALMGIFGFKRVEEKAMDRVSDTRRAVFDKWWSSQDDEINFGVIPRAIAWKGFNAALDAVEIELPQSWNCEESVFRDSCSDAIESTNLGLRIK